MSDEPRAGFLDEAAALPAPLVVAAASALPEAGFLPGDAEAVAAMPLPTEGDPDEARARRPMRSVTLAACGLALLVFGGAGLALIAFVLRLFGDHPVLGWAGVAVAAGGLALLGRAVLIEWRGLASLRDVTRLRQVLADRRCPIETSRPAALAWARRVVEAVPEAAKAIPEIERAATRDDLVATLRSAVLPWIEPRVTALGRRQAMVVFTAAAASPSPALDTLIVLWRGLALVGAVARLHGARPGALGLARLVANVSLSAAATAAADVAGTTAASQFVTNTLAARLGGDAAGASLAAMRMMRLARAAAIACSPLPP